MRLHQHDVSCLTVLERASALRHAMACGPASLTSFTAARCARLTRTARHSSLRELRIKVDDSLGSTFIQRTSS